MSNVPSDPVLKPSEGAWHRATAVAALAEGPDDQEAMAKTPKGISRLGWRTLGGKTSSRLEGLPCTRPSRFPPPVETPRDLREHGRVAHFRPLSCATRRVPSGSAVAHPCGEKAAKTWMSNWDCEGESGLPGCVDTPVDLLVEGYDRSAERTAPGSGSKTPNTAVAWIAWD